MLPDVKTQTREELKARFDVWGQPAYRVVQLLEWLYCHRVTDWDAMTNLPRSLRGQLRQAYSLQSLELLRLQGARDTTQKYLWRLSDRLLIESVLIPASPALYSRSSDRHTLCVSTQVGCAYGCKFCASGLKGWKRNLGVEEIVDQVLAVERWHESSSPSFSSSSSSSDLAAEAITRTRTTTRMSSRLVDNLVIMGMGEPLANYDNLMKALKILNAPWGGGIGARKITISTIGLAPRIRRLADEPLQFRLAVSLHGATDDVRNRIVPVNHKYPLKELTAACDYYQRRKGKMVTFEYILIAGANDRLEQVKPLAQLARRLDAKVNLIPYNPVVGLPWERPGEEVQERFLRALEEQKVAVTLRREKGGDIDAACGQLRLKTERELAPAIPGLELPPTE